MRERAPLRSGRWGTCRWALRGTAGYTREGSHFKLTIWRQELESPSRFIPSRLQQADLRLLGGVTGWLSRLQSSLGRPSPGRRRKPPVTASEIWPESLRLPRPISRKEMRPPQGSDQSGFLCGSGTPPPFSSTQVEGLHISYQSGREPLEDDVIKGFDLCHCRGWLDNL